MSSTPASTSFTAPADVKPSASPSAGRILTWLAIQLATLVAGATGLRFSADYANPGDLEAVRLMLAVQIVAATALYRYLYASPVATIIAATSVWPFVLLAGFLSGEPAARTSLAAMYVSVWVAGLGLLKPTIGTPLSSTTAAVLTLLVLSGPMLGYLSNEFGGRHPPQIGPIFDAFRILDGAPTPLTVVLPTLLIAFAILSRLPRR